MQALTTYFAAPERAPFEALREASDLALRDDTVVAMLEAMPSWAMLVNRERQIVAANSLLLTALGASHLDDVLGQRPGEALGCEISDNAPSGCGTARECAWCGAAAMTKAIRTHGSVTQECLVLLRGDRGHALDLEIVVSPALFDRMQLLIVAIRDTGAEKRRRQLERVFFHDVMNTASGIQGIARVLATSNDAEMDVEFKQLLVGASEDLIREIADQRQLMAAETGEIVLSPSSICVGDLLRHVCSLYAATADGRILKLGGCPELVLETDLALLRRVVGNMVKNALEASRVGDTITVWAEELGNAVLLAVHNPGVMSDQVAAQVFHRSFSTKGIGRGIGTYSIKLLGERYLRGHVAFTSTEQTGTTFTLRVPVSWPDPSNRD